MEEAYLSSVDGTPALVPTQPSIQWASWSRYSGDNEGMTASLHLVPRLKMCIPTPPACFHGVYVENYISLHLNEETECNKETRVFLLYPDVLPQFKYISLIGVDAVLIGNGTKEIS